MKKQKLGTQMREEFEVQTRRPRQMRNVSDMNEEKLQVQMRVSEKCHGIDKHQSENTV